MASIVVSIKPTGETSVKAEGVAGPGCKDLTKFIENALGTVTQDTDTEEMHYCGPITQDQQQRQ